jgi:dTDP-4-dehydrorhamnose 3,5-epimerase-like enzyme
VPFSKVTVRRLPVAAPPVEPGAGRVHSEVGELVPIAAGEAIRFVAYIDFVPHAPRLRGNHYHETKTETLYVIRGKLAARYQDLDTGEDWEAALEAGDLVTVAPRCAHVYQPTEYTQAIEVATGVYDPLDTIRHVLWANGRTGGGA